MNPRSLDEATVTVRLRLMQDLLDDLAVAGPVSAERLEDDRLVLRAVERILTQLVDLAVAVNTHIVARESGRAPTTYRASFADIADAGVLPADLSAALTPSVGLRNLLVHEYARVDIARVAHAVPLAQEEYGEYVRAVARWLAARS